MKKLIIKSAAFLLLLAIVNIVSSCKKSKSDDAAVSTTAKELLGGTSSKIWLLNKETYNGVEQCLTTCSKTNDRILFSANGSYAAATFTCDARTCGMGTIAQTGGIGTWSVSADGKTLTVDGTAVNLVTLSSTEMVIEFAGARSYYVKGDDKPLLTRNQQIAGTTSKVWKYAKRIVDGVEQPLTATLLATRFTNLPNGSLVTSYTDSSQPTVNGSWAFNTDQSTYTSIRPASGTTAALNLTFTILELTDKTFITVYTDGGGHLVELYQVPETI